MTVPDPAPGDVISSATSYRASLLQAEAVAPRSREIRLGIVMYGGLASDLYLWRGARILSRRPRAGDLQAYQGAHRPPILSSMSLAAPSRGH